MQPMQLSIPEPCQQNWNEMTPTQQGRYCNACAKQVVDFSMMSDAQLLNYFSKLKNENVCGRVYPDQLERSITMPKPIKKRLFWHWNYITMLFLFFSKTNEAKAQAPTEIAAKSVDSKTPVSFDTPHQKTGKPLISNNKFISGAIIDIQGNPVPFATVSIVGTKNAISADADGKFLIKANRNDMLEIAAAAFKIKHLVLSSLPDWDNINIRLEKNLPGYFENAVTGGIFVGDYTAPAEIRNHVAVFEIKDDATSSPIKNAQLDIERWGNYKRDTGITNGRGLYKIKRIKNYGVYQLKITANGYEGIELEITGKDFNERKILKEIRLRKLVAAAEKNVNISLSGMHIENAKPILYKLDNIIVPIFTGKISQENINGYKILQAAAMDDITATGINKQSDTSNYKTLDSVIIRSYPVQGRLRYTTTTTTNYVFQCKLAGLTVYSALSDSIKTVITKITGALKIYPNPVIKGNSITISLSLKNAGNYNMQLIDASGKIILQKQFTATAKQSIQQLPIANNTGSGIYYVRIFDGDNRMVSTNNFMVQ